MFSLIFLGTLFVFPRAIKAQLVSVSGYVKNYITDKPVENAAVYEAHSGIGTITNSDGYYRLWLKKGEQELKISNAGFEDSAPTFLTASDTIVSVNLKPRSFSEGSTIAGNKHRANVARREAKHMLARKNKKKKDDSYNGFLVHNID
ncbi:CarboxypepD_reg-like domain-containing protein [Mariniphaga anaerophila]|uniref:CarboxypepD_reg-like domain-containing protein n=1 Tax=Mariniphaga anaerophila TaxID=1484053 RepID=A0A1M4ZSB7_9BACT|nr:carboxypeptidase-like regulatory domain-containing protein [Mariniphaga anaerophila]SHF20904.1 CarboxypepD_reg-like domain-containing protein [Mariniphaga anaerophila]